MIFDGAELKNGDHVHDVMFGTGQVDQIIEKENKFTVNFSGSYRTYTAAGVGNFPMKTLYWKDPIGGFIPPKDEKKWELFCALRKSMAQVLAASTAVREN